MLPAIPEINDIDTEVVVSPIIITQKKQPLLLKLIKQKKYSKHFYKIIIAIFLKQETYQKMLTR